MPALSLAPALSFMAAFTRLSPTQPIRTFIRTAGYKLRPPRPVPFEPVVRGAQDALIAAGVATAKQAANILIEERKGTAPTIVLGGFVPDATEQVFLLRGFLLRNGSIYYVNFPREGFSADLIFAQLDDLVTEIEQRHGVAPVIFSVSFGCGLVLEWLKRARRSNRRLHLQGLIMVSPVACVEDLISPGEKKPSTLLGRAVKPFIDSEAETPPSMIEKSRTVFTKMFEAGAQNKASLRALMTMAELKHLHSSVMSTIRSINVTGACERIKSLKQLEAPTSYFSQALLPLSDAPALILYSEKEGAVLTETSPTRFALEAAHRAYFPNSTCRVVSNHSGSPVQHASLIFHCFNFLPPISAFYKSVKARVKQRRALAA